MIFLIARSSVAASSTYSQGARSARFSVGTRREAIASAALGVILPRATPLPT